MTSEKEFVQAKMSFCTAEVRLLLFAILSRIPAPIPDLSKKLFYVRSFKSKLEQEAARLEAAQSESFAILLAFIKNAIKALEDEDEVIVKNMKIVPTPITFVDLSKNKEDEEVGTLQERLRANGSHHKVDPCAGAYSFASGDLDIKERTNLFKRKWASVQPSQAPFICPSFGAMPTGPTSFLPQFSSRCSPIGHGNRVRPFSDLSDTMGHAPQMVSDNVNRVLENHFQPSSETLATRYVSRVVLDKGKQVVENAGPHGSCLLRHSSNVEPSRLANRSGRP